MAQPYLNWLAWLASRGIDLPWCVVVTRPTLLTCRRFHGNGRAQLDDPMSSRFIALMVACRPA